MKNFVEHGGTIEFTASGDVVGGQAVPVGAMVAVSVDAVADTATGVGYAKGVFTLPKVSANVIAQGDIVYITDAGSVTSVSTDNTLAGKAWTAAGNGDTEIDVSINV